MASAAEVAILLSAKDQASQVIQKLSGDLDKLGTSAGGLGSKFQAAGQAIAGIAAGAAVAGVAALAAGLGAAVKAGADFEAAMSSIKAVSGATAQEMAQLQETALQLGKDTSFSAKEAADGIEELVKAGVSITDVIGGGAAAALSLAAAGGVEVGEAAEIAANAMNVFNKSGSDMGHVADVIAGAVNTSAIGMNDFKFALAASGAVANTVGVSFEDLSTAIAAMGNAGIKGSDAGTSLKTFLMNLTPTTKAQTKAFRELGLITEDGSSKFFDAAGNVKSMAEVAGLLQEATKGLTKEQKLMALEAMFGSDAIRAAAVIADEGAEGFQRLAAEIGKVTAAQVASERLNNLKGALEQLKGSLETAAISVGLKLMPALTMLTQWATEQVNAAIPSLEAFAETLANLFRPENMVMVGTLIEEFNRLKPAIAQSMSDAVEAIKPAVSDVVDFITAQFGTVVSWFQENWPLIAQTNQTVTNEIKAAWGEGGGGLSNVVRVAWEAIKTIISTILTTILGLTRANLQILNGDWAGAWQTILQVNQQVGQAILDILYMIFGGTIQALTEWVSGMVAGFTDFGSQSTGVVEAGMSAITGALSGGWEAAASLVTGILAEIQREVMAVWNALPDDIAADLALIANHLVTQGQQWVQSMVTAGQGILQAITTWLAQTVEAITTWATSTFLAPIQGLVGTSTAAAGEVGSGMSSALQTWFSTILSQVQSWVGSFVSTIRGIAGQVTSAAQEIGQAISNGIANGISAASGFIRDAAYRAARSALDAAKSALGIDSPSKVFREQVGVQAGRGLIEGLMAMQRAVSTAGAAMVAPMPALAASAVSATPISSVGLPVAVGGGGQTTIVNVSFSGSALASRFEIEDVIVRALDSANRRGRLAGVLPA